MKNPHGYFNVVNMRDPILLEILFMDSVASTSKIQKLPQAVKLHWTAPNSTLATGSCLLTTLNQKKLKKGINAGKISNGTCSEMNLSANNLYNSSLASLDEIIASSPN